MTGFAPLAELLPWILGVLGVLGAGIGAWASGRQAGRAAERQAQDARANQDREKGDAAARAADRDADPVGRMYRDFSR